MASPYPGIFSPGQFIGWAAGPAIGLLPLVVAQLIFVFHQDKFTANEIFWLTAILSVAAAFLGGGAGYLLSWWFDETVEQWFWMEFRHAFLFGIIGSIFLFSILTFPLLSYFSDRPRGIIIVMPLAAFIAGLVPGGLNGILNNLQYRARFGHERPYPPEATTTGPDDFKKR